MPKESRAHLPLSGGVFYVRCRRTKFALLECSVLVQFRSMMNTKDKCEGIAVFVW